jgi:hypothetical protein
MEIMKINRAAIQSCLEASNRCASAIGAYFKLLKSHAPPALVPCFAVTRESGTNRQVGHSRSGYARYAPHLLVCTSALVGSVASWATPPPGGVAPLTFPAGGFGIDGDLMANSPLSGAGDWLPGPGSGGSVLDSSGNPLIPASTFHFIDPFNTTADTTFGGGLKWTDDPNTWSWTSSKPSSKTDINNVLLHMGTDTNGHTWTVIAADRASTSGDSYIDFEFLQNTLTRNSNGTFTSAGLQGGRTTNDLLLSLAFTSGGSVADFLAFRWQPNGSGGYAYVDVTSNLPIGRVFVALNTNTISVPYGAFGLTQYTPNAFVEAALDMTALIGNFNQCLSFGFKSIMVKTKSSASSTATISDFIDPIQFTMHIGPSADAGTNQTRCSQGSTTDFALYGTATPGLQPVVSTTWSVISGSAIIDSPTNLLTTVHVSSTNATLRLTVIQSNGCTETDDVILTVAPMPDSSITGPSSGCPASTMQFSGPTGMVAYAWSISGNGTISGAANGRTVTVLAGTACGTNFTLTLSNTSSNGCSTASTNSVLVNDTTAPTLFPPADLTLECPANTSTNATGAATAQDGCGYLVVTYNDTVVNNCGNTKVITRMWTATDRCGNHVDMPQTITVRDITPPVITKPADVTLECPANTNPTATGTATAVDGCGATVVSYSDSVNSTCGGSEVISRTWTATDACGNISFAVQKITVRDTTPPTIVAPANLTLDCPADTTTNATGVATATDTCSLVIVTYSDIVSNNCGGTKFISRIWTATDACGNTASKTQTINVRDISAPSISAPADVTLECPADTTTNTTGVATAQDVCSSATISYTDSVTNACGGTKLISRTWKASDPCGNSATAVQHITVVDTTPPTITSPADVTLECPANTSTNATGVATAQDGCGSVRISYSDIVSNNCGGTKLIARTWTATDACGNVATALQNITVRDTTPPSITAPANLTLECPANTTTNATGIATAQDGCGSVAIGYSDVVSNSCGGTKLISRTWTATDACGNIATALQTITVRDITPPSITKPANVTLECPADTSTNSTGVATALDGCGSVAMSYSDVVSNSCGGTKLISRTWTATDDCGNVATALQTITVRDITPPSLSAPANVTLECPATTTTDATGMATALDGCGSVAITFSDSVSNNCGGSKIISRKWKAVDDCGNIAIAMQIITIRDITPPTIAAPADLTLECPANTTTNATGVATAQDGCSAVTVSYSDVTTNSCGGTKVISRTWKATDGCGNISTSVQTITVRDTTPPTITSPANVTLDCPATTTTNATGVATAQDGCGSVTINYSDAVTNNCGASKIISRTWTATDACGNVASAVQTITVRDITPPTITGPANVTLECPANTTTNATGVATASDGCSSVAISYSDVVSNSCAGTKLISRTWKATDACGNFATALQTITVRDTTPPSVTAPANLTLECPANTATNATGVATAQDGCGSTTISYSDVVSNSCGGTKVISRTWTATDGCGNFATAHQTITVRDTTPPTITSPANLTLECPAVTTTNVTGVATAQDGCGATSISYSDVVSNSCGGAKFISRTWIATDACGNTASALQTITVRDTTKPTLTVPSNVTLECPATNTGTNFTGAATAIDGCSAATVSYSDVVTTNCGATRVIARTWTAADQCGNVVTGVQTITVRDTTPPNITAPADLVLECPANTSTNATGVATAFDGCGSVTISYSDSVSNNCGGAKIISRRWTAVDQCGNSTNAVQTITVRDTTPPSIVAPADLTVECPGPITTNATGTATAVDGCGSVTISYSDSVSNNCGGSKVISRLWRAADGCGNAASAVQTITVRDTTPPSLKPPANLVLQCPANTGTNATGVAIATDGCGSVTLTYSDVVSNSCGQTRTVLRLWTATDQCGNTTNALQTIAVVDTTKPTIVCPRVSVQCVGDVPPPYTDLASFLTAGGTASDSCSSTLTFSLLSDGPLVGRCPGTVTRVYRVIDDCGNIGDGTQTITVDDTIPPVLTCPSNTVVECGSSIDPTNSGMATATDNCSTNVTIRYSDSVLGSSYNINFYAADPAPNSGPYQPTYLPLSPASLPRPASALSTGRAADPLRNAVAFGPTNTTLDALTSLSGETMYFGQIVPFEAVLTCNGGPGPERGTVEFTADWATYTTSNDRFGYDTNYMIYCAFVDTWDQGNYDPLKNARVESYSAKIVNPGTVSEQIEGTIRVSGLDPGDQVVVEIWVVLNSVAPRNMGGTIAAQLVSANKVLPNPESIFTGSKTISISANKILPLPAPQQQPPLGPPPYQAPVPTGRTMSVISRTWTATDDCNNSSTCSQTITVTDSKPPVITAPANLTLECPVTDTSTNVTGAAIAQDACGSSTISYSDVVSNSCPGTRVLYRTWTAIDDNGFTTNVVQTITVRDSTPPALIIPADISLECPAVDTSTNVTGTATALDACSSTVVSFSDSVSNTCGGARSIARTWTAVDDCGNVTNAVQTITIQDTTPPTIAIPVDLTLECPADTTTNATGVATAVDGCSSVFVSYNDVVTNACANAKTILRTWTAVDSCGNAANAIQTITVRDTTPPKITSPADVTLECPANTSAVATGLATAQDGCGSVSVTYKDMVTNTCANAKTILRTWTAVDTCGNTATALQTITVRDTTPPVIEPPADAVLQCPAQPQTNITGVAMAHDGCGSVTVHFTDAVSNSCAGTRIVTRTWTATDDCNNSATAIQTITITDSTAPSLMVPKDLVLECPADTSTNATGVAQAQDGCSTATITYSDVVSNTCGSSRVITRTWTATDECGNVTNAVQTIAVRDTTPPTLVCQPDRTVIAGQPWNFDAPAATDNCGTPTVVVVNTSTNQVNVTMVMNSRTWLATDDCGNTSTCTQNILVQDKTSVVPPAITTQPKSQNITLGANLTLNVAATGTGPLAYQWRFNGNNIAGATTNILTIAVAQFGQAGLYSVVVSNQGGTAISTAAIINVTPTLQYQPGTNGLVLTWPSPYVLQWASTPSGPYTDVPGAHSPWFYSTAGPQKYFRLRAPSFSLTVTPLAGGQYSITSPGIPGANFVLQATTDFHTWVNLATNPFPCAIVDTNASQYPYRFYRAVLAPMVPESASITAPIITTQPLSQTLTEGANATLSVSATGTGPLAYQWRVNGANLPGATGSSLVLASLQFSNAGLYSVIVSNAAGTVTSSLAVLNVAPKLFIQTSSNGETLTWSGPFVLQSATSLTGPYTDVHTATSPYFYNILTNPPAFFRLRAPSFTIASKALPQGQFEVTAAGVTGYNLVIQASTDLKTWSNLSTNTAPCNFVDTNAAQYPHRFYRAVLPQ